MDNKRLIKKALMGDKQAQEECTEKRIVLPCPYCGRDRLYINAPYDTDDIPISMLNHVDCDYEGFSICCDCDNFVEVEHGTFKDTLAKWNTRHAPSIGRCGECKYFTPPSSELGYCTLLSQENDWEKQEHRVEMLKTDYCSYFEPREE